MATRLRRRTIPFRCLIVLWAAILLAVSCAPKESVEDIRHWKSTQLRDHPLTGKIWLVDAARFIPPEALIQRLSAHKFVLLGERHDNPDHHRIQAWVTMQLVARGGRPALVMEMFRFHQQGKIDSYLNEHPGDSAGLGAAMGWHGTGWPDWRHYEPIVRPVVGAGLPLLGANLSRRTIRAVVKKGFGALPPGRLRALNLDRPVNPRTLDAMDREIADAHCGFLNAKKARPFTRIQLLRDAGFAAAMRRAIMRAQSAVLIAGAGHVRRDRGVSLHLRRAGVKPREIFSLGIVEVSKQGTAPPYYGSTYGSERPPFDAIWFTPRQARGDPCEMFKSHRK